MGCRVGIRTSVVAAFCLLLLMLSSIAGAQVARLITKPIDETQLVTLRGSMHPLAQPQFDLGQAPPNLPLNRMLLVLKRSDQQEHALRTLLDSQQDKNSSNYHKWLTPDQFGTAFGPSDQDLQAVTGWLQSHGLQINNVSRGKTVIEFSGVESQVEAAFNTQIHQYLVNGEYHWANASDPAIPAALVPAVAGVRALDNFPVQHFSQVAGVFSRNKANGQITPVNPQFTLGGSCGVQSNCYAVGPYDFATIYDVANSWSASPTPIDGTGQTIAIVGETDINPQDVDDFRNFFGLPAYGQPGGPNLNIIHTGPAPGILTDGEESESDLDVEWSGAVAKGASVDFVVAQSTETTAGVDLSALYIVDNNLAPVMSESYGICELHIGQAGNQFFSTLWEQAAAQGITVMLSSGDGSSAGCDNFDAGGPATLGLAVSGFASTPFNVAVGGTDFFDLTNATTYWNPTNAVTTQASAIKYIPETTWNDTCTNPVFGALLGFSTNAETNCNNSQLVNNGFVNIVGGSGGRSGCISSDGVNPSTCTGGYAKPSWQNAPGVPNDNVRDVPDISLYAASGSPSGSFYIICEADAVNGNPSCVPNNSSTNFLGIGGTSASSPAFAGIMALVNQQTQARQGNANFVLYKLAQQHPTVFHDVTTGTIEVPCQTGSLNCTTSRAGDQFGILNGYNTGIGYDLATGIGSVDVGQLLQNWTLATFRPSLTTLALSPTTNITHGQSVNVTASVAPSTGTGTPTGDVSLLTSTGVSVDGFTLANGQISGSTNLLPGGTYTVTAHYGGDTTFGGSDSSAVNVTVGKENSSTQLLLETLDFQGNLVSNNATTAVYGSPYILRVNVLNSQGAVCQPNPFGEASCPSGNVALTDNGSPLDAGTFALNSLGFTEDQTIQLSGGSQAIKAQYAGDNSFNLSSGTTTYTITPARTTIAPPILQSNPVVGADAFFETAVQASPTFGAAPTGSVTFLVNGTPISGQSFFIPETSGNPSNNFTANSSAQVTTSTSPFPTPGLYAVTASYSGDGNYQSSISQPTTLSIRFSQPPIINIQASSQSIAPGSPITLTATVSGASKTIAPTGTVTFNGNEGTVAGTVSYSTITDPTTGFLDLQAALTISPTVNDSYSAQYSGDNDYFASSSNSVQVTINGADFSISSGQSSITVLFPGASNTGTLVIGFESSTAPVSFAANPCAGLPSESTCSITPNAVTGAGNAIITIGTTGPHALVIHGTKVSSNKHFWPVTMLPFAAVFLIGIPRRRFRRGLGLWSLAVFLLILPACGGGGSGGSGSGAGGGGANTDPGTPAGSYAITVTATSGPFTHSTSFQLVVQ